MPLYIVDNHYTFSTVALIFVVEFQENPAHPNYIRKFELFQESSLFTNQAVNNHLSVSFSRIFLRGGSDIIFASGVSSACSEYLDDIAHLAYVAILTGGSVSSSRVCFARFFFHLT